MKFYSVNEIENMYVYGRTVVNDDCIPLFWNHSGVEVRVTGSELWIEVETDCGHLEPWIATELNGAMMSRQMLMPGNHSICLFRSFSPDTVKTVKFYRELQAVSEDFKCKVLVKGFRTDGEFLPVLKKKVKLEFVGDSISSGEGTYGASDDTEWTACYMSSSRHYAHILEKAFNADVRIISQGGWGVYSGWDNDVRHNIPSIYEKVCGLQEGDMNVALGAQKENDFESWQPDAVIINLGTNDNSCFNTPPLNVPGYGVCKLYRNADGSLREEDADKIKTAVINFLKMVRLHNPKAHILWAYGMLGYELTLTITDAVNVYVKETGDKNVAFINLPDTNKDTVGAHGHPGYKAHIEAAKVLGKYLGDRLGLSFSLPEGNL